MDADRWKQVTEAWNRLPPEERRRIAIERIPRKVARSMAFTGEPVDQRMLEKRPNAYLPTMSRTAEDRSVVLGEQIGLFELLPDSSPSPLIAVRPQTKQSTPALDRDAIKSDGHEPRS